MEPIQISMKEIFVRTGTVRYERTYVLYELIFVYVHFPMYHNGELLVIFFVSFFTLQLKVSMY